MFTLLLIESDLTVAGFKSQVDLSPGGLPALQNFENYVGGLSGGLQMADLDFFVGATQATGTLTFASVIATDAFTINGVSFECVASGATGNQFDVGGDDEETAANAVAAINASASALVSGLAGVTATSEDDVITLTARMPGVTGNAITIATGDGTITPSGERLTGGTNGTTYALDFT